MKRSDFLKGLGVLPAAFLLPQIGQGSGEDFRFWGAGYKGYDCSLRLGFYNEADEQFFIGYREVEPDYENWKEHFMKPTKKSQPQTYIEAARSDHLIKTLSTELKESGNRYSCSLPFLKWSNHTDLSGYYSRMAVWCELLAKQFRSMKCELP